MKNSRAVVGSCAAGSTGLVDDTDVQLLRRGEVVARTTISPAQIYVLINAGKFPPPIELGPRARAWLEIEIDAWLRSRMDARPSTGPLVVRAEIPPWRPAVDGIGSPCGIRMIRLPEVMRRVRLCKSEIYRRIHADLFPRPVAIGVQSSAWVRHEIEAWVRERLDRRLEDPRFAFLVSRPPSVAAGSKR